VRPRRKHLIGLVACAATIALCVGVASFFRTPEPLPPPAPAVTARLTQAVFNSKTRLLSATVELRSAEAPPERVSLDLVLWPEGATAAGVHAEPIEIRWPAGGARTATVEVSAEVDEVGAASSIYAGVAVSPDGSFSEKVPVLVAEGARRGR
jgi:hypothetical protein